MELLKHTLYINLEERIDRRIHTCNELEKIGIKGERYNAKKTKNGAVGCTISHIGCLELAKQRNYPYVFICEDDITFLEPDIFLSSLKNFEKSPQFMNFDVLIIGGNNCPPYEKLCDSYIKISNCQTTTGYIVKSHYYDTLLQNFKDSALNLMKYPERKNAFALDIYWKKLQQIHNWYMIIPPTVVQYANYSDVEEREVDYNGLMMDLDKKWLISQTSNDGSSMRNIPTGPNFKNMFYVNTTKK
jgi:glycosyl transferase family 25